MARNGKFGFDLSERAISLFKAATDMPDVLQELAFDQRPNWRKQKSMCGRKDFGLMFDIGCLGVFHTETLCGGGISPTMVGFLVSRHGANRSVFERSRTSNSGGVLAFRLLTGRCEGVYESNQSRNSFFHTVAIYSGIRL